MRLTSSRALLVLLAAVLLLSACKPQAKPDEGREQAVRRVVETYNVRLAEAFRAQDMNALNKVATRDQATTEYYQMSALAEGKVRLLSTPRALRFVSARFSSNDTATVETEETWDYEQVSMETSRVVRTERGVVYRLSYVLVRREGRWLVDSVRDLASKAATGAARP
jgi:hypothetical protein